MIVFGRVGGELVVASMRAWRLVPEPEMRTVSLVGGWEEEDMALRRFKACFES